MDLELMYFKSNQDPKLYDLIMDIGDDEFYGGKDGGKQKKQPVICK